MHAAQDTVGLISKNGFITLLLYLDAYMGQFYMEFNFVAPSSLGGEKVDDK